MSQVYIYVCINPGRPYHKSWHYYFGPFTVDQTSLFNEMYHFDQTAKVVFDGRAPDSCYIDNKTRLSLWDMRNSYDDDSWGKHDIHFDIFTDPATQREYAEKAPISLLNHILTCPYNGTDDLTLGQSLLPITRSILMKEKL